jgi:hypothetical protein
MVVEDPFQLVQSFSCALLLAWIYVRKEPHGCQHILKTTGFVVINPIESSAYMAKPQEILEEFDNLPILHSKSKKGLIGVTSSLEAD